LKKIVLISIALVLFLGLTGCAGKENAKTEAIKPAKITIGIMPIEDTLPFFIAEEKRYFEDNNLDVELITFDSAHERDAAFQAGRIDAFIGDPVVAASLEDTGMDASIASIVLGAKPDEGRFAILASPKSSINNIEDLKEKEIAVSYNSIIEYFVDELLMSKGFKNSEIEKIEIPKIPIRLDMLLSGQVEAAALPDPLASLAELKGAKLIIDDTQEENLTQTVLIFNQKYLENNTENVCELLKAISRAVDDINAEPNSFKDLLVQKARLPEPIKDSYEVNQFPKPQLPKERDINRVLEWMRHKGLLENEISYEDLVTSFEILP